MIPLQYKLMRRVRRGVKKSVNNLSSNVILHSHKVSVTHCRKRLKISGGQSHPAEHSADEFTKPTFEELSDEECQVYEVLKMKRNEEFKKLEKKFKDENEAYRNKLEEEDMQMFLANLEKDRQENITSVGQLKLHTPCSDQGEPSNKSRQEEEEALQIDRIHEENKNDLESMVTSVEKAESNITYAESIE